MEALPWGLFLFNDRRASVSASLSAARPRGSPSGIARGRKITEFAIWLHPVLIGHKINHEISRHTHHCCLSTHIGSAACAWVRTVPRVLGSLALGFCCRTR